MAYVEGNPKTKKQLREWLAAGRACYAYQPGPFPLDVSGNVYLEGPHYPKPHTWYAVAHCDAEGRILRVK